MWWAMWYHWWRWGHLPHYLPAPWGDGGDGVCATCMDERLGREGPERNPP